MSENYTIDPGLSLTGLDPSKDKTVGLILVDENGKMYRQTVITSRVMDPSRVLEKVQERFLTPLPLISEDTVALYDSQSTSIEAFKFVQGVDIRADFRLNDGDLDSYEVDLTSDKKASNKEVIIPSWRSRNDSVRDVLHWTVPTEFKIMFHVTLVQQKAPGGKINFNVDKSRCCLFDRENSMYYHMPMPNIYANMKLCTGPINWTPNKGMGACIDSYFEAWSNNAWNSDLLFENQSSRCYRSLVQYELESKEQIVPKPDELRGLANHFGEFNGDTCGDCEVYSDILKKFDTAVSALDLRIFPGEEKKKAPEKVAASEEMEVCQS
jgi:hypothetical protein